ncbi:MAG: hypothetical protein QM765_19990 [Myxococcales bacterium]
MNTILEHDLERAVEQLPGVVGGVSGDVGDANPLDEAHREELRRGDVLVDLRQHEQPRPRLEVARDLLDVPRLVEEVELLEQRRLELAHDGDGLVRRDLGDAPLEHAREPIEQREIGLHLLANGRALDLDDDLVHLAVDLELRAVRLRDRRRRDRLQVERREVLLDGRAEVALDDLPKLVGRHRRDVRLQLLEGVDDVARDQVWTGRQDLPELDERGPELFEHPLGALAPRQRGDLLARPEHPEARHLGAGRGVDEEPVPGADLEDGARALQVPDGGRHRFAIYAPRRGRHSSPPGLPSGRVAHERRRPGPPGPGSQATGDAPCRLRFDGMQPGRSRHHGQPARFLVRAA